MSDVMQTVGDFLKRYWILVIVGILAISMLVFMRTSSNDITELENQIDTLQTDLNEKRTQLDSMDEFDPAEYEEQVETNTISAREIGEEMIAVDNHLTDFYKMEGDVPEDEDERQEFFDAVDKWREKNTELTGATEDAHANTWQLNPDWSLELLTVVNYQNADEMPIVFRMTTTDGDNAGLVRAIYNARDHRIENIMTHYTADGLSDQSNIGGS